MNKWISVRTRMPEGFHDNLLLRCMDSDVEKFLSGSYENNEFSIREHIHNSEELQECCSYNGVVDLSIINAHDQYGV